MYTLSIPEKNDDKALEYTAAAYDYGKNKDYSQMTVAAEKALLCAMYETTIVTAMNLIAESWRKYNDPTPLERTVDEINRLCGTSAAKYIWNMLLSFVLIAAGLILLFHPDIHELARQVITPKLLVIIAGLVLMIIVWKKIGFGLAVLVAIICCYYLEKVPAAEDMETFSLVLCWVTKALISGFLFFLTAIFVFPNVRENRIALTPKKKFEQVDALIKRCVNYTYAIFDQLTIAKQWADRIGEKELAEIAPALPFHFRGNYSNTILLDSHLVAARYREILKRMVPDSDEDEEEDDEDDDDEQYDQESKY